MNCGVGVFSAALLSPASRNYTEQGPSDNRATEQASDNISFLLTARAPARSNQVSHNDICVGTPSSVLHARGSLSIALKGCLGVLAFCSGCSAIGTGALCDGYWMESWPL